MSLFFVVEVYRVHYILLVVLIHVLCYVMLTRLMLCHEMKIHVYSVLTLIYNMT